MGQFSFFTQDTKRRIKNYTDRVIIMTDNKGHQYREDFYEGYGVFGGKDYYELLAEMNGAGSDRLKGVELAFHNAPHGDNPDIIFPSLSENGKYFDGKAPKIDNQQGFSPMYHLKVWGDNVLLRDDDRKTLFRFVCRKDDLFGDKQCKDIEEVKNTLYDIIEKSKDSCPNALIYKLTDWNKEYALQETAEIFYDNWFAT